VAVRLPGSSDQFSGANSPAIRLRSAVIDLSRQSDARTGSVVVSDARPRRMLISGAPRRLRRRRRGVRPERRSASTITPSVCCRGAESASEILSRCEYTESIRILCPPIASAIFGSAEIVDGAPSAGSPLVRHDHAVARSSAPRRASRGSMNRPLSTGLPARIGIGHPIQHAFQWSPSRRNWAVRPFGVP